MKTYSELEKKSLWVRQKVLEMAAQAGSGHVTSAFSQTEMLVALYQGGILRCDPERPRWDGRDRFILSKGQGGIGLYPVLADKGFFPVRELDRFAQEGNRLGVHAEWNIPGIETVSGSLGHGLPVATGMAQAAINDRKRHLVFCMLGDAELYEGSNWEAAIYAGHKRYSNLVCMVDRNGQGVLGFTDRVEKASDGPRLESLEGKFKAFGFEVRTINGHCFPEIFSVFKDVRRRRTGKPLMIIARTHKGRGVSIMEDRRRWHYRVPAGEELEIARRELREVEERGGRWCGCRRCVFPGRRRASN